MVELVGSPPVVNVSFALSDASIALVFGLLRIVKAGKFSQLMREVLAGHSEIYGARSVQAQLCGMPTSNQTLSSKLV